MLWLAVAVMAMALFQTAWAADSPPATDLPTGYNVVSGSASFQNDGTTLSISASNKAIIEYSQFNIGEHNTVNIYSPLSLHRIVGNDPSQILGQLNSTGRVVIINANGVRFGINAEVNAKSLVTSTLNLSNQNFLSGIYAFQRDPGQSPAGIINQGHLQAQDDVGLIAGSIQNSGTIQAAKIDLAVGDKVTYTLGPDIAIQTTIDEPLQQQVANAQSAIENSGTLRGNVVQVQAKLAQSFYNTTVNNTGIIEATGLTQNPNGQIVAGQVNVLGTSADTQALVQNSGTVTATNTQGVGGHINWLGDNVLVTGNGLLDASGQLGGGQILLGGDYQGQNPVIHNALMTQLDPNATMRAEALQSGNGGRVILWADHQTAAMGNISVKGVSQGGFVETSGKQTLLVTTTPDISASNGHGGLWLLDPNDLTISTASTQTNINGTSPFVTTNNGSSLGVTLITNALANGDVTISTGSGGTNSQTGSITWSTAMNYTGTGGRTLTVNAHNNINLNAAISSTNALNLVFNADSDANGTGSFISNTSGTMTTAGGTVTINAPTISLSAAIATTSANVTLNAGSTIIGTKPITTGIGVVNITAPTSANINYNVNTSSLNMGTISTPSLTLWANGTSSSVTLNNSYSGTTASIYAQGTSGNVTVNGDVTTSTGNLDLRSAVGNVTVTGNVTDASTTGTSYLAAGWTTFALARNLSIGGTVSIAGGATKQLHVYDGDGATFSNAFFTDGGNRTLNTLSYRRYDASGAFNLNTLNAFANPTNSLSLITYGTSGHITVPNGFNGTTLTVQTQGTTGNITFGNNVTVGGVMDIRSWSGSITVNGDLSNTGTTGTNYLAAGSNGVSSARDLNVTGTLSIAGGAAKTLFIYDGTGDIFSKGYFTDAGARAFSAIDFRRCDNNGTLDYASFSGLNAPSTSLTLVTTGTSGHITAPAFTGTTLIAQAQGTSANVTGNGNISTSGTLDLRAWTGNVTVNGNVSNTGTNTTNYLAAGWNGLTSARDLSITGTLNVSGHASKKLYIFDGNGDVFSKAYFTDSGARAFNTLDFRRADASGTLNFPSYTAFATPSAALTLITFGSAGHITAPAFTGTSLTLQAQGTGSNITVNGNVSTTSTLDVRSWASNVTISGNVSNTGTNTTNYLAAGSSTFSANSNLNISGTLTVSSNASKTLYIYDGDGDVFSKAFFGNTFTGSTVGYRSGTNTDFGSVGSPWNIAATTLQLQTLGNAYVSDTSGTLNLQTLGTGVSGLLYARTVGNLTVNATSIVGSADFATTAGNGNIALTQSLTTTSGGTFVTNGTGSFSITNAKTLSSTTGPLSITSRTITLNSSGAINASSTGTVSLKSNTAQAINLGAATKSSTFDITTGELALITAGTLSVGDSNVAGGLNLGGNLTVAGSGAGKYNLTFNNAGNIDTASYSITLGDKDLNITSGGTLTTSAITGVAGSVANLTAASITFGGTTSVENATITSTGTGGAMAINNPITVTQTLNLISQANSSITQTGALTAPTLALTSDTGNITLNNTSNAATTLTATRTGASGTTSYTDTNALTLGASSNSTGNLTVTTNSGILSVNNAVTAGNLTLVSTGNLELNTGTTLTTSDTGNSLILVSTGGNFVNNVGSSVLSASAGRWLIYSGTPSSTTIGGLTYNKLYNQTYSGNPASGIAGASNMILYRLAPTLTVTANNTSKTYGASNPSFTSTITGFVDSDTLGSSVSGSAAFSTAATDASNVGTYAITPSLGTLASGLGYQFTYTDGTLTVDPKALSITANDFNRDYGSANPTLAASYSGFVLGQSAADLTGSLSLNTAATASSNVGNYTITPSGQSSNNYSITYHNGTLTVDPKALSITANDFNRDYGSANPTLAASYSGFVLGQSAADLTGSLSLSTAATASSSVGNYTITPSGQSSSNYAITYHNGTLTVDAKALSITANDFNRDYGSANPTLAATYSGFVLGQSAADLTGSLSLSTAATASSNVGNYTITPSGQSSSNYAITYHNGTLTVDPKALSITANDFNRDYGSANPSLTASYSGFVLGQSAADLSGSLSLSTAATASSNVGTYAITPSGQSSSNYSITYHNGTLTVDPKALSITADNATKVQNTVNPSFSASYNGFVLGQNAGVLTGPLTLSTTANLSSGVGNYDITPSGQTSSNYSITYHNGTLNITSPAPVAPPAPSNNLPPSQIPFVLNPIQNTGLTTTIAVSPTNTLTFGLNPTNPTPSPTSINSPLINNQTQTPLLPIIKNADQDNFNVTPLYLREQSPVDNRQAAPKGPGTPSAPQNQETAPDDPHQPAQQSKKKELEVTRRLVSPQSQLATQ
jgi:filamentous hemagglutinin family protein